MTIDQLVEICSEHDYDFEIVYDSGDKLYMVCIYYGYKIQFKAEDEKLELAIEKCASAFKEFVSENQLFCP